MGLAFALALQRQSEGCHAEVQRRRARTLLSRSAKDYGLAGQPGCATLLLVIATASARQSPNETFFYVYVLVSETDGAKYYTGLTQNLRERLRDHNRGACVHTSKHGPWRLETAIAFSSEAKADAFEQYLKGGSGREFARRHF